MSAELHDGHLDGVARPGGRLLEQHRHALAGEHLGQPVDRLLRKVEHLAQLIRGEVVDLEEVTGHARTVPRQDGGEDSHRLVDLVVAHVQRRSEAECVRGDGVHHESCIERGIGNRLRVTWPAVGRLELDRDQADRGRAPPSRR